MNRRELVKTSAVVAAAASAGMLNTNAHAEKATAGVKIKITKIEPILLRAARHYPAWLWVRIRTDQGVEGLGEGFCWSGRAAKIITHVKQLGEKLTGTSPLRINAFVQKAFAGRPKDVLNWGAAVSAIEIALWDIAGRVADLPVHALLGGAVRKRIPLYADHGVFAKGFDVERIVMMKEAGFGMFKWDPFRGGGNPGERTIRKQLETVIKVRQAVGEDYPLAIDAHGRFNLEGAKIAARAMSPYNLVFFEEPVHYKQVKWFGQLADTTSVPLSTGEMSTHRDEVAAYMKTGALAYFQPELGVNGGILETVKTAALCESFGVKIATHDWCGPVVSRAASHVCAAIPNLLYQEWASCAPEDRWEQELLDPPARVEKGHLAVPSGPGLGAKINEKNLKRRRIG